jgi:heat shock protein HslJ
MNRTDASRRASLRRARVLATVAAAGAALLLAGCAGSSGSATPPTPLDPAEVAGVWADTSETPAPSLMLAPDGSLTGTDGCNRLTGTWELDDDGTIEFGDFAATRMACEGVDTWLSGAEDATVSGTTMTVFGAKDREIGTLERTGDADAIAASAAFVGTWGPNDASQPHLVIADDGRFSGGDGCNALVGGWQVDDEGIEFESTATTLMACPGATQQLGMLHSATVDGDSLTVLDEAGEVLIVLERTA